jgi:hypothetical protein
MGRTLTEVGYVIADWETNLDEAARRYKTDPERVYFMSRALPRYHDLSFQEFKELMVPGALVRVPIPLEERGFDFRVYQPPPGETLATVCAKKNADPARTGMPKLTPSSVWLHVTNWHFRAYWVSRKLLSAAQLDDDPSAVQANKETPALTIPYPAWQSGKTIHVGPDPASESGAPKEHQVAIEPEWVRTLLYHLKSIKDDAERLQRANLECDKLRQGGAVQTARLIALQALLAEVKRTRPESDVVDLLGKLGALVKVAGEHMAINPASFIGLEVDKDRQRYSARLRDSLGWDGLKKLVDQALADPKRLVNGTALIDEVCHTLNLAYMAWSRGYCEDTFEAHISQAVSMSNAAQGWVPPGEAKIALASLVSIDWDTARKVVGPSASLMGPVIGNLPGPSNLLVAVAKMLSERLLRSKIAFEAELGLTKPLVLKFIEKALSLTAEEKLSLKFLVDNANAAASAPEGSWNWQMSQMRVEAERTNFRNSVSARLQSSARSHMTVAFINTIAFVLTITDKNEKNECRRWASLGGSFPTALAGGAKAAESAIKAYQLARQVTSGPAVQKFLELTNWLSGKGVGWMGAIGATSAIICGGLTAWEGFNDPDESNRDVAKGISGVLQMAGGGFLAYATIQLVIVGAAPYTAPVVVPEIAASLLLVASTISANWNELKALRLPGTQTVFTYHLKGFGSSSEFKLVSARSAALKTAYAEVLESLESAQFKPLLLAEGETFSSMRLAGMFGAADVEQMYVERLHFPPNFSQKKAQET